MARFARRVFLSQLGRGTLAVVVLGAPACSPATTASDTGSGVTVGGAGAGRDGSTTLPPATATTSTVPAKIPTFPELSWHQVSLGFVSAYVLIRAGEAAVVDTGVEGSSGKIEAALAAAGVGWGNVGHLILTHSHPDHVGSLAQAMVAAPAATAYAGEADIAAITSPRAITPVTDGDVVFGMEIITTPGHTPGHISVLDPAGSLLMAGDALNGQAGGVIGPNPDFTADMPAAIETVRKLARLRFEAVVFGHGDPVESDASTQVAALAATL